MEDHKEVMEDHKEVMEDHRVDINNPNLNQELKIPQLFLLEI